MANIKGFNVKIKAPENIPIISKFQDENAENLKTIRKTLEEKMNEKVKVYGFIGMEVYDLSKENRIEIAEIKSYLDKMDSLNSEIEELEKQKKELENKSAKNNVCVCGYKLKPQDRFCPNCGKVVEDDTVICSCGARLEKNAKFCHACGKSMEELTKDLETAQIPAFKECICGAKVPAGQFMCMECGRKIEN